MLTEAALVGVVIVFHTEIAMVCSIFAIGLSGIDVRTGIKASVKGMVDGFAKKLLPFHGK